MVGDEHETSGGRIGGERARRVEKEERADAQLGERLDNWAHGVGAAVLIIMYAAANYQDFGGTNTAGDQRAGMTGHSGLGKAWHLGEGNGERMLNDFRHFAEARAKDDREGGLSAAELFLKETGGGAGRGHLTTPSCSGPKAKGRSSPKRNTRFTSPDPSQERMRMSSPPNSRSFWRQPPQGVRSRSPSPRMAISTQQRAPDSAMAAKAAASAQTPSG